MGCDPPLFPLVSPFGSRPPFSKKMFCRCGRTVHPHPSPRFHRLHDCPNPSPFLACGICAWFCFRLSPPCANSRKRQRLVAVRAPGDQILQRSLERRGKMSPFLFGTPPSFHARHSRGNEREDQSLEHATPAGLHSAHAWVIFECGWTPRLAPLPSFP